MLTEINMKKKILAFLTVIFISAFAFAQTQIHIAGSNVLDAVYWLNGVMTVLPKSGEYAKANAIVVSSN